MKPNEQNQACLSYAMAVKRTFRGTRKEGFLGRKDFEEVLDGMCDKKTTLFVPSNAVSAYKEASGWKSFIVRQMKNYNYGMGCSTNWIKA